MPAVQRLLSDRTTVIISHRVTTVAIESRVLVLDDGRVVEDGNRAQLLAQGRRYAEVDETWAESLVD